MGDTLQVYTTVPDAPRYAERDEERQLAKLLDVDAPGVYVDIGCNGELGSVTLWLYREKGWRGLLVDAREECLSYESTIDRPEDTFIRAAVCEYDGGRMDMVLCGNLSRFVGVGEDLGSRVFTAPSITINTLIRLMPQFAVPALFNLDIEGAEWRALSVCDFDLFQPGLMVIEQLTTGIGSTRRLWECFVTPAYDLAYENKVNTFWRRRNA